MKKGIHYFALILLAFILMNGGTACMENPNETETSSSPEILAKSDREIVEIIFSEWWPDLKADEIVIWADEAMEDTEALSGKLFGRIISEEDAMEKAQAAWIELGWSDDFENEDEKWYKIEFYDEYNVWMVDSFSPSESIDSEGREYPPVPGSGYCAIMQKADGKVLAAWIS